MVVSFYDHRNSEITDLSEILSNKTRTALLSVRWSIGRFLLTFFLFFRGSERQQRAQDFPSVDPVFVDPGQTPAGFLQSQRN